MNNLPKFFTLDGEGYDFKCADCGEKHSNDMASEHDVALCVWCCPITQDEQEQQKLMDEADHLRDEYRERGLSRSDFFSDVSGFLGDKS